MKRPDIVFHRCIEELLGYLIAHEWYCNSPAGEAAQFLLKVIP